MTSKKVGYLVSSAAVLALALLLINTLRADAQTPRTYRSQPPAAAKEQPPREVTLEGRVVDLHCMMTGQYPSTDHAKCTADCIRAGVPAALETETGFVILGQGMTGPVKTLTPLAYQQVEARGKLFEKGGVKYLDISSIWKMEQKEEEDPEEEMEEFED